MLSKNISISSSNSTGNYRVVLRSRDTEAKASSVRVISPPAKAARVKLNHLFRTAVSHRSSFPREHLCRAVFFLKTLFVSVFLCNSVHIKPDAKDGGLALPTSALRQGPVGA